MTENPAPSTSAKDDFTLHLARALRYSPQHRNAIGQWLHRHLPELWPAEKLEESSFYERLKASAEHPDSRITLWTALSSLADKKPKWAGRIVPLEPRLITQSFIFSTESVAHDLGACQPEMPEKGPVIRETLEPYFKCLAEHGHPQFASVWDWLMANKPFDQSGQSGAHVEASTKETSADAWARVWRDVADLADEALAGTPDRELEQALLEASFGGQKKSIASGDTFFSQSTQ